MSPLPTILSLFVLLLASSTPLGADVLKEGKICFPDTKNICLNVNSITNGVETANPDKAPTWRVETSDTGQNCIRIKEAESGKCLHEQATRLSISPCEIRGSACEVGQGWTIIGDLNGKFQLKGNREQENKCIKATRKVSVQDTNMAVVLNTDCDQSPSQQEMTIV